jgi:hypothetical protein
MPRTSIRLQRRPRLRLRLVGTCCTGVLAVSALAGCSSSASGATASSTGITPTTGTASAPTAGDGAGQSSQTVVAGPSAPAAGTGASATGVSGQSGDSGSNSGSGSGSSGAGTGAGAGGSNACTSADLSLQVVEGAQSDDPSHTVAYVVLTNTSRATCVTIGYPGVDFFAGYGTSAQSDLHMQTARQDTGTATTLTLAPGGQATSTIAFAGGSACKTTADTVQVIPPNQTTALHAGIDYIEYGGNPPHDFPVCSGDIQVWPLQSGYDGPHR